ncbi:GntR family transcriptional regulator [Glaciihabitans sp. INWT7]|uniref:GntR family transcriptional regulator n=1 Tax=Glaciihabitans sp. INWT7 TaxID=2596912 RepID=UPI001C64408A|nr:GntR family transcriptional regulator [Glaciihabitans sp. INWT7]
MSDNRTSSAAGDRDKSSFATSPVVNLVFERVLTSVHEGRLLPGQRISDSELAEQLGVSRTPVREALQRLRDIGIIEASASRFTRVALVTPKQTADAMVVWVALYSALVNEVIPLVTPEMVAAMRADHALFLEHVSWALDPKRMAELRANPQLVHEHVAELVPQKIAMANAKFFNHLVGLSQNPSLVRGINSVVHLIQLGSLYLPDYLDFRALSESQQLLIAAARDHDRAAAQGALRMLGLISVPTAALEAEAQAEL